jgi:hypothetical protein
LILSNFELRLIKFNIGSWYFQNKYRIYNILDNILSKSFFVKYKSNFRIRKITWECLQISTIIFIEKSLKYLTLFNKSKSDIMIKVNNNNLNCISN